MTVAAAVMSSARTGAGRDDWRTPTKVLERVRRIDSIGLDPCSDIGWSTKAETRYTGTPGGVDGLTTIWTDFGLVYVNPPYSQMMAWATKAVEEATTEAARIIMLVPSRTDTAWWRIATAAADAVAFWRGRITFVGAEHPAPFPSAIIAYNIGARALRRAFGDVADVWVAP